MNYEIPIPPSMRKKRMARLVAAFRSSPWTSLGGKALVAVLALFVLAWVGRSAPRWTVSSAHADEAHDAGPPPASTPVVVQGPPTPPVERAVNAPAATHSRATAEEPVFLNYGGIDDLRRLPGVGLKRAEAIVALRGRVGRFQRIEDLMRVKGIGRATVRKWRPLLRLDSPPDAGV